MNYTLLLNPLIGGEKLKIESELIVKDDIDSSGDQVGIVKVVEWDFNPKRVESIELKEAGISSKIGLGEKKIVPINIVEKISNNILLKIKVNFSTKNNNTFQLTLPYIFLKNR